MVAEREEKVIKACCRRRREKGCYRNKCRPLRGRRKRYNKKTYCRRRREKGSFRNK